MTPGWTSLACREGGVQGVHKFAGHECKLGSIRKLRIHQRKNLRDQVYGKLPADPGISTPLMSRLCLSQTLCNPYSQSAFQWV